MIIKNGGEMLRSFTEQSYKECVSQVTPGVWHVLGLGHSNAIFIEGSGGVILIDTLDTLERGQKLSEIIRSKTGKEVNTIIYTHGHPDHRGGAGAFSPREILAFSPKVPLLDRTGLLADIQNARGARQFGYALTDRENISQGIGIREGLSYGETRSFVPPTTVYDEDRVLRDIEGVRLEMVRLVGETDDQIMVWLGDQQVLCCGDNYYGCWPNLYAIRGSQYRDIGTWIKSLETLLSYPAQYLLPGHTSPVIGKDRIQQVLGNFREAIDFVLSKTLEGMNQGKGVEELAAMVRLPEHLAGLPYLGEYYGCVDWTVRAIYTAYLGWFDGNPTRLHPLPPMEHAHKTIALMGGLPTVMQAALEALKQEEYQWCLELCDLMTADSQRDRKVLDLKADALEQLAELETSANGRHYYITCAHELREEA